MQKYIGGLPKINTLFFLLKKDTQSDTKTIYFDTMEARVFLHLKIIAK